MTSQMWLAAGTQVFEIAKWSISIVWPHPRTRFPVFDLKCINQELARPRLCNKPARSAPFLYLTLKHANCPCRERDDRAVPTWQYRNRVIHGGTYRHHPRAKPEAIQRMDSCGIVVMSRFHRRRLRWERSPMWV